jgi:hypothetical protein
VSFYELQWDERPHNISDEELARHLVELKYRACQLSVNYRKTYAERGVKLCAVLTGPWEGNPMRRKTNNSRRDKWKTRLS